MKRTLLLAVLALAVAVAAPRAIAQNASAANQNDGGTWYLARYAKFKPGMAPEAQRIIHEHFWPVDQEIGRPVIAFDFVTGDWDHVVYLPLTGPGDLALQETALGKRWKEVLARREGGRDKADALEKRLGEMVLAEKSELVRRLNR